jgi:hypothetical protein
MYQSIFLRHFEVLILFPDTYSACSTLKKARMLSYGDHNVWNALMFSLVENRGSESLEEVEIEKTA